MRTPRRPKFFSPRCSQRTKNIRIGHGIVQTPPHINHPARIAERIATLDLLSDGRVEFGTGAGATETELGGFNVPQAEKKNMQLEGMRVAVRMLVEDPFHRLRGPVREECRRATWCRSRCRSRIRRCGWRVPAASRSFKPRNSAWAR